MTDSNNVLTIKTVQIAPFRTLMTALKDILLETNITFKKDGIRMGCLSSFSSRKYLTLRLEVSALCSMRAYSTLLALVL